MWPLSHVGSCYIFYTYHIFLAYKFLYAFQPLRPSRPFHYITSYFFKYMHLEISLLHIINSFISFNYKKVHFAVLRISNPLYCNATNIFLQRNITRKKYIYFRTLLNKPIFKFINYEEKNIVKMMKQTNKYNIKLFCNFWYLCIT